MTASIVLRFVESRSYRETCKKSKDFKVRNTVVKSLTIAFVNYRLLSL